MYAYIFFKLQMYPLLNLGAFRLIYCVYIENNVTEVFDCTILSLAFQSFNQGMCSCFGFIIK